MQRSVELSHPADDVDALDELASLRAVTPPPDLSGALHSIAAVTLLPLLAAAGALALHPLAFTPGFLLPTAVVPAVAALLLARRRTLEPAAALALAVAAAASTVLYLGVFAALTALARGLGF
jgi:hypothetical protein